MTTSQVLRVVMWACFGAPFAFAACSSSEDSPAATNTTNDAGASPTTTATTTSTTEADSGSPTADSGTPTTGVGAGVQWKSNTAAKVSMDLYIDFKRNTSLCPVLEANHLPKNARVLHLEIEREKVDGTPTWQPGTHNFGKSTAPNGDTLQIDYKGAQDLDATCTPTMIAKPTAGTITFTQVSNMSETITGSVNVTLEGGGVLSGDFVAGSCDEAPDGDRTCEP